MNKCVKSLLTVVPIYVVLAGLTVLLCLLDSTFDTDKIIITVVLAVWAFFIVPSVLYAIGWAKANLSNADPARSFRIGWIWGDLIFLFLIIIAPVSGVLWFAKTIKDIASSVKNAKHIKNTEIEEDIFNK